MRTTYGVLDEARFLTFLESHDFVAAWDDDKDYARPQEHEGYLGSYHGWPYAGDNPNGSFLTVEFWVNHQWIARGMEGEPGWGEYGGTGRAYADAVQREAERYVQLFEIAHADRLALLPANEPEHTGPVPKKRRVTAKQQELALETTMRTWQQGVAHRFREYTRRIGKIEAADRYYPREFYQRLWLVSLTNVLVHVRHYLVQVTQSSQSTSDPITMPLASEPTTTLVQRLQERCREVEQTLATLVETAFSHLGANAMAIQQLPVLQEVHLQNFHDVFDDYAGHDKPPNPPTS